MTEKKLLRHHVYIGVRLTATGKFTQTINCPFVPDEVKVKQVCETGGTELARVYQIQCPSLTSDGKVPLASYTDPVTSFVGMTFPMNKSIDGSHDFTVVDCTGAIDANVANQYLSIHLEFRKYV